MADFTCQNRCLAENIAMPLQRPAILPMRCLCCFAFGAQLLNLLVHAPGVYERLMQVQKQVAHGGNWFRCRHHFWADPF